MSERGEEYRWRETYFVFFDAARRPTAAQVHKVLTRLRSGFEVSHESSDPEGLFESITIYSPADFAAMEISFEDGDEVLQQAQSLAGELRTSSLSADDMQKLSRLARCRARMDVMHFERISDEVEAEGDEMFDPSALIVVLERLAELTGGVAVDPQSGSLV